MPPTPRPLRAERLEDRTTPVALIFDYSLDTGGFFNSDDRRALLQTAGDGIVGRFNDTLNAVNLNNRQISNPANMAGPRVGVTRAVPADTLVVYAAGGPLGGGTVGQAGASFSSSLRGETGANEYAPDVGYLSVDNDGTTVWDFDTAAGRARFQGIMRHELMHTLGITSSQPSWANQVSGGLFNGPRAMSANGGVGVPLSPDGGHPAQGTNSVLQPSVTSIRELTPLDWALLDDIGWDVAGGSNTLASAASAFASGETGVRTPTVNLAGAGGVHLMRVDTFRGYALTADTLSVGGLGLDTYLRLFDAAGNEVAAADGGGVGLFARLSHTFAGSGTYYLGFSLFDNRAYNPVIGNNAAATGVFAASLTLAHGDSGGVIATATDTGLSGSGGQFGRDAALEDFAVDADLYRVAGSAGATLSARTLGVAGGALPSDAFLRLFDSSGRQLVAADNGGPGRYARLSYTLPATGTYFVGVSSALNRLYAVTGSEPTGDRFFRGGGDYRVELSLSPTLPFDDGGTVLGRDFPDLVARTPGGDWWVAQNSHGNNAGGSRQYGTWNEAAGWRDVRTLDLNGDGLTDIAGRTSTGQWYGAVNRGVRFDNVLLGSWNEAAGWRDVQTADIDGDGDTDFVGRTSGGAWFVALNAPLGGVARFVNAALGQWNEAAGWRDVRALDFDGDGDADLLGRTAGGAWWLGRSGGGVLTNVFVGAWNEAAGWRDVRVGDFTGDGRPDLAARTAGGQWYVARNLGGAALDFVPFGAWNEAAGWRDVMVGDFAGDSAPDLVGRTASGAWFVAVATRAGFENQFFGQWNEAAGWRDVMAGNFAGGGKDDIVGRTAGGQWFLGRNAQPGFVNELFASWASIEWRDGRAGFLSGAAGGTGSAEDGHGGGCGCAACGALLAQLRYERAGDPPTAAETTEPATPRARRAVPTPVPLGATAPRDGRVGAPRVRRVEAGSPATPVARRAPAARPAETLLVWPPRVSAATPPPADAGEPADPLAGALFAGVAC